VLRRLPKGVCDGYVVDATWATAFADAMGGIPPATVFFYPGKCQKSLQPLIDIDTDSGVGRAIQVFAEEGATRIGLLGGVGAGESGGGQELAYNRAMEDAGLAYRAAIFVDRPWQPARVRQGMARLLDRADPPEAVYISDDHFLQPAARELASRGLTPGRDLAVITLANRGIPLPNGTNWSRIEFDPMLVGQMTVDSLLQAIRTAGHTLISFSHNPTWWPGETHTNPSARSGD
jgi:DNA-binding LacI/PurR family transcriptional regulator